MAESGINFSTEDLILHQLITNPTFHDKSWGFIEKEYFENEANVEIFRASKEFWKKYDRMPAAAAIKINLEKLSGISDDLLGKSIDQLERLISAKNVEDNLSIEWLFDTAEKWVVDRAVYNVYLEGAQALQNGKHLGDIPDKLQKAMALSFDFTIGLDYMSSAAERYDIYHDASERVPFHIEWFNRATGGGIPIKTLTCYMSTTTGGFKSGTMCDHAVFLAQQGYDVLYLTMELSQDQVMRRLDANMLDVTLDGLNDIPKTTFINAIDKAKGKYAGNIIVKEYPTSSAHAGHFRYLLKELRDKKNFRPKVIFFDYINICASARLSGANVNSYTYIKTIAEELRGLCVEFECAGITATQGNRGAIDSSDVSIGDVSESVGLPATVDLFVGIITNDDLDMAGQIKFKVLKNRFGDMTRWKYVTCGVEKGKMRLVDLGLAGMSNGAPNNSQQTSDGTGGIKDTTSFGKRRKLDLSGFVEDP